MQEVKVAGLPVRLERKAIKHMYLRMATNGDYVKVSAGRHISDAEITHFINKNRTWIETQHRKLRCHEQRQETICLHAGAFVDVWGKPVMLAFEPTHTQVFMEQKNDKLVMYGVKESNRPMIVNMLNTWYKQQTAKAIDALLPAIEERLDVKVSHVSVRYMSSRWGSATPKTRRIRIHAALSKAPQALLELVLVHELVHFHERLHGKRFQALMNHYLPDWRARESQLKGLSFKLLTPLS